jgi:hypothetical protein
VKRTKVRLLAACGGVALAFVAQLARADMSKAACAKANADGQALQLEGKLSAARGLLVSCGDPSCPAIVRDDCAQRLNELERLQPTIIFDVKDGAGSDVSAVSVTVDGQPLADKLGGLALEVDPGEHTFTFTATGHPALTKTFVLKEAEKDRRERVVLAASEVPATMPPPAATTTPSTPPPGSDEGAPRGMGTMKILGLTAGGVGVAGLAVGGIFGALTFSAVNQQKTDCGGGSGCSNRAQALSDHSTASTDSTVSNVSFIAGGALLAIGTVLFLTAPSSSPTPASGWVVLPGAGPGGGALSVLGEF